MQGCLSAEEPEKFYASRLEVTADDAIGRGWVPPWLPSTAHAINETHNIDTNEVWMIFEFDPLEMGKIEACKKDNTTEFKNAHGPRIKHRSWWSKPTDNDWAGYICRWHMKEHARQARLIVSQKRGIAFYWEEH